MRASEKNLLNRIEREDLHFSPENNFKIGGEKNGPQRKRVDKISVYKVCAGRFRKKKEGVSPQRI